MIVIHCSEDGDKSIEFIDREAFLKRMNDGYYEGETFAKSEEKIDLDYFIGTILIDGKIVAPKSKRTVKEWDL